MILFIAALSLAGWLCGIWLPWWLILMITIATAISAYKGDFDGGLEAIPTVIGAGSFHFFMFLAGFFSSNTTTSDVARVIRIAFTGQ